MIQDISFPTLTANTYSDWAKVPINKFHNWRVLSAQGLVTLQFAEDGPERQRVQGNYGITHPEEPIERLRVKSTVDGDTVIITVGNELEVDTAGRQAGGVPMLTVDATANRFTQGTRVLVGAGATGTIIDPTALTNWSNYGLGFWISLDPLAPGPVRLGDPFVGSTSGSLLMPGETRYIRAYQANAAPFGAISAYNPNPVGVYVSCTLERRLP